jgi:hypothetical protein
MGVFKGQNLLEFAENFKIDADGKEYVSKIKWVNGFEYRK